MESANELDPNNVKQLAKEVKEEDGLQLKALACLSNGIYGKDQNPYSLNQVSFIFFSF